MRSIILTMGPLSLDAKEEPTGLLLAGHTIETFLHFLGKYNEASADLEAHRESMWGPSEVVEVAPLRKPERPVAGAYRSRARKNIDLTDKQLASIHKAIGTVNGSLTALQRQALALRYPEHDEPLTIRAIGEKLHVDRVKVTHEIRLALRKIGIRGERRRGRPPKTQRTVTRADRENAEQLLASTST